MIDFSSLSDAVQQLTSAREEQAREPDRKLLQAGLIQTFEFTYELSHKMLRRYLASLDPSPSTVAKLGFEDLIRSGDEAGLLQATVADWRAFREARTITSHTYNAERAEEVLRLIPEFHREVVFLLERLLKRTGQSSKLAPNNEHAQ